MDAPIEDNPIFLGSKLTFKIVSFVTSIFVSVCIYAILNYYVLKKFTAIVKSVEKQDANSGDTKSVEIGDTKSVEIDDTKLVEKQDVNLGDTRSVEKQDVNLGDTKSVEKQGVNSGDIKSVEKQDVNSGNTKSVEKQDVNLGNLESQNNTVDSNNVKVNTHSKCGCFLLELVVCLLFFPFKLVIRFIFFLFKLVMWFLFMFIPRLIYVIIIYLNEMSRYLGNGPAVLVLFQIKSLISIEFLVTALLFCVMVTYSLFLLRHVIYVATKGACCSKFYGVNNSTIYFGLRTLFHFVGTFVRNRDKLELKFSIVSFVVNILVFIGHLLSRKRIHVRAYLEYLSHMLQQIILVFVLFIDEKYSNKITYIVSGVSFVTVLVLTCLLFNYTRPKQFV
jgi:hypothetical protein